MRTKKTKRDLNRLRALATAPMEWCEIPGWVLGHDSPSILTTVGPHGDDITLAADVSRQEYLEAVAAAVEAGEFPAWVDAEASWLRFQLYRDHDDHGATRCWRAGTCHIAEHRVLPAAPMAPPVRPTVESYGAEGVNQRSSLETPQPDEAWEQERLRLLRIAQSAPVKYFT